MLFAWKHKPPLHNYRTFHHHRFQAQACPFHCRNSNKADAIYQLWGEERTWTFSWISAAAGCSSYAGKGKTVSHTLLKLTVGVQGKLIGFRTLLDLIHGSDAGHHYSNAVRVCINENWWIPFLQTQKRAVSTRRYLRICLLCGKWSLCLLAAAFHINLTCFLLILSKFGVWINLHLPFSKAKTLKSNSPRNKHKRWHKYQNSHSL